MRNFHKGLWSPDYASAYTPPHPERVEIIQQIFKFLNQTQALSSQFAISAREQAPTPELASRFEHEVNLGLDIVAQMLAEHRLINASWVGVDGKVTAGRLGGTIRRNMSVETGLDVALEVDSHQFKKGFIYIIRPPQLLEIEGIPLEFPSNQ